jgi:hypothetical protein
MIWKLSSKRGAKEAWRYGPRASCFFIYYGPIVIIIFEVL